MAVNYLAVVLAAIVSLLVGWLWYGPLFGKAWIKHSGLSMDKVNKKDMPKLYVMQFVSSLVTAFVLASFLGLTNSKDLPGALSVAFWAWLGFFAAENIGLVAWEGKSWNLFSLKGAGQLADLLVMAVVLSLVK